MYEIGASPPGTFAVCFPTGLAVVAQVNTRLSRTTFAGDSRCEDAVRPLPEGRLPADDEQLQPDEGERGALAEASGQSR